MKENDFRWQHIEYEDCSNPYICMTKKRFKQLQKKYGDRMVRLHGDFWLVKKDENENHISLTENLRR